MFLLGYYLGYCCDHYLGYVLHVCLLRNIFYEASK